MGPYISVAPRMVPARCPRCATSFWASHSPFNNEVGWAFCPRCQQPTPSLPPRQTPPLFSWEVYRRFYPEPAWPRSPSPGMRRALFAMALLTGLLLLGIGGAFAYFGGIGLAPVTRTVGGTLSVVPLTGGSPVPTGGIPVTLTNASGTTPMTILSGPGGSFSFAGVPAGEHQLKALAPGYRPTQLELFLAPQFDAPAGNISTLALTLVPGNATTVYDQPFAPYPDLETYLAYLFSASAIEAVGGLVALWGAWSLRARRSAVRGVVGLFSGVLTPLLAWIGGFQSLFLLVAPPTLVLAGAAGVLGFLAAVLLLRHQRPLDGVELPPPPTAGPP